MAEIVASGVPAGWGEPVFDKLKADLGKALFSLPAVLGVEYGSGFGAARLRGSENNDPLRSDGDRVVSDSNRHGGMLGGISSGAQQQAVTAGKAVLLDEFGDRLPVGLRGDAVGIEEMVGQSLVRGRSYGGDVQAGQYPTV